ncbi:hypothetical protein PN36_30170 [Candidatus Thiomargarita nelsonii]|uniref:Uncharacterized protein n=1 Tax=Candidatus Thiomargarita nelsonii TaxID=1003181 RepID=A0A4E0RDN3_9GAMM|nr:hypothetical protein PN36_30170 [Candidatus Thiomargarita nelsonii]
MALTLRNEIEETLWQLAEEPFAPSLLTQKIKEKLSDLWACRVGYDMRRIFDDILLLEIGTHDEVY